MKSVQEMLAEKREALKRLNVEIATLEEVLRRESGQSEITPHNKRSPRSSVKNTLLRLLEEAEESGLNAHVAVVMAAKRGVRLERSTVSSLLSRLKNDKIVSYDGKFYRLTNPNASRSGSATIIVHPVCQSAPAMDRPSLPNQHVR